MLMSVHSVHQQDKASAMTYKQTIFMQVLTWEGWPFCTYIVIVVIAVFCPMFGGSGAGSNGELGLEIAKSNGGPQMLAKHLTRHV